MNTTAVIVAAGMVAGMTPTAQHQMGQDIVNRLNRADPVLGHVIIKHLNEETGKWELVQDTAIRTSFFHWFRRGDGAKPDKPVSIMEAMRKTKMVSKRHFRKITNGERVVHYEATCIRRFSEDFARCESQVRSKKTSGSYTVRVRRGQDNVVRAKFTGISYVQ